MTIDDLIRILEQYDSSSEVRIATGSRNGLSTTKRAGLITLSTPEVYGPEIVIHPDDDENE